MTRHRKLFLSLCFPALGFSTPIEALRAQACAAPDTLAQELRAIAQLYLSSPDHAPRRRQLGIPAIDTASVALVAESTKCTLAYRAWRASAPHVPVSASPYVYLVSFGSFYMSRILPRGHDSEPDAIYVVYDSNFNVLFRFGLI